MRAATTCSDGSTHARQAERVLRTRANTDLAAARSVVEELAADLRSSDLAAAQEAVSAKATQQDLQSQV